MSLSEPLPLANAQLELGRSQVIKLEEEMALVIGEGHTCMAGSSRDRQLVARLPMVDTVLPSSEPSTITTEAIRRALDALSPDDREMILLVAVDELSAAQLGVVFNCSAIAARTRLYRARNRLAELLGFERGVQRLTPSRHEQVENDKPWEALR